MTRPFASLSYNDLMNKEARIGIPQSGWAGSLAAKFCLVSGFALLSFGELADGRWDISDCVVPILFALAANDLFFHWRGGTKEAKSFRSRWKMNCLFAMLFSLPFVLQLLQLPITIEIGLYRLAAMGWLSAFVITQIIWGRNKSLSAGQWLSRAVVAILVGVVVF
jgi:hypothetical protein